MPDRKLNPYDTPGDSAEGGSQRRKLVVVGRWLNARPLDQDLDWLSGASPLLFTCLLFAVGWALVALGWV